MEKKRNWILRIVFPVLCCCVILISCVVPANATDTTYLPSGLNNAYQSVAPCSMEVYVKHDNTGEQSVLVHPLAEIGVIGYTQEQHYLLYEGPGLGDLMYSTMRAYTDITQYAYGNTNSTFHRIRNRIMLPLSDPFGSGLDNYTLQRIYVYVDPWTYPSFDAKAMSMLNNAFVVTGCGTFQMTCTFRYVDNKGVDREFYFEGRPREVGSHISDGNGGLITAYGRVTCLYWDELEYIRSNFVDYNGGYFLIQDMMIHYNPTMDLNDNPEFGFDIIGDRLDAGGYPSTQYAQQTYYTKNNIKYTTQTSAPGTGDSGDIETVWQGFFAGIVGGFLDAPLFGEISIGQIMFIVIGVCIAIWLLKVFAGG